ncbi:MAG: hypothetical protein ACHREM_28465, partial [Polyangiales bacterium]
LYGILINGSGPQADETALVIAPGDQTSPRVAAVGTTGFEIVFGDGHNVSTTHVTHLGTIIQPGSVVPLTSGSAVQGNAAIATDGVAYFATWDDGANVFGNPIATNGSFGGPGGGVVHLTNGLAGGRGHGAITYDGGQYVVAWQDHRASSWDVYAARVSGGVVLDGNGFAVAASDADETLPAVGATSARLSLVAYQSATTPTSPPRVYVRALADTLDLGQACGSGADCASGHCVSSVCCSVASCDDGLACTADTCLGATCGHVTQPGSCVVGNACIAAGAFDPLDGCQSCQPSVSTTTYSPVSCSDGLSCTIDTCSGGACFHAPDAGSCVIGGACVSSGAVNPSNGCQTCQPSVTQIAFSNDDGRACPTDGDGCHQSVCNTGSCTHPIVANRCEIGGVCFARGDLDPSGVCEACDPTSSAIAWTSTTCPIDAGVDAASDAIAAADMDAGSEATTDAATDVVTEAAIDAASDAANDAAGDATADAIAEATIDAASDAVIDTAIDAAIDVATDAAIEAPIDAPVDAIAEAPTDAPIADVVTTDSGAQSDASAADASADATAQTPPAIASGCGCRAAPRDVGHASWAGAAIALVTIARRRRRADPA